MTVLYGPDGRPLYNVGGDTAHDAIDAGNPVKIGGVASASAPTAVSADGDRVNAWLSRFGAANVVLRDTAGNALVTTPSLDAAPNVDTGVLAIGQGPGFDRKLNPAGVSATSTASAVTIPVDGASTMSFAVTTIGVTPGAMIFEVTADDGLWQTASHVYKMQPPPELVINSQFVPAVGDVYLIRCAGYRQVRYRVNVAYASGTATVKVTAQSTPGVVSLDSGSVPAPGVTDGEAAASAGLVVHARMAAYNNTTVDRVRTFQALTPGQTTVTPGVLAQAMVDPELAFIGGVTPLRESAVANVQSLFAASLADSVDAALWATTNANGGTSTAASGETTVQTSAAASGSSILQSLQYIGFLPGMAHIYRGVFRVGDTGLTNNSRRWGVFTTSGTTPADGYYFELSGTTFNAVSAKASSATAVASGSWTRAASAPFTIDTNYHLYEIVFHDDYVAFLIDGRVRHVLPQNTIATPRTAVMQFPVTMQSTNASATATNALLATRGVSVNRWGTAVPSRIGDYQKQSATAQYSTAQTSTILGPTVTATQRIVVTAFQIGVGGTTASAMQLYFGAGAYTRGTNWALFDHEWAPSTTLKPGIYVVGEWEGRLGESVRVTDASAINPLTVTIWYRLI